MAIFFQGSLLQMGLWMLQFRCAMLSCIIDIDALKFTNKRGKKLRTASLNSKFTDSYKNKCKLTEFINGSYSQTGVRKPIFRDCYVSLTIILKKNCLQSIFKNIAAS